MKITLVCRQLLFGLLINSIVFTSSFSQNLSWVKSLGGSDYYDKGTAVVTDKDGFVYLGGNFKGNCVFDDGSQFNSTGGTDMFLAKYTAAGVCLWTIKFGGDASGAGGDTDFLSDLALDTAGNVLVVGRFMDNLTIGDTSLIMSGSLWNGFIAKFDPSGNFNWVKKGGSTALNINAICVNQTTNEFYITGDINASTSFGAVNLTLIEYSDAFLVKFNQEGTAIWGKVGSGEQEFGNDITSDELGNVYVIGDIWGNSINFEGTQVTTNTGSNDLFILKYNSNGVLQWLKPFGGPNDVDYGLSLAYHSDGFLYATGKLEGNGTFGTHTFDAGNQGSFLMQLDLDGNVNWLTGGKTGTWGNSVGTDTEGNVYWYGTVWGTTNISNQSVFGNEGDIFIGFYTNAGTLISLTIDGGANQQGSNSGRNISMGVDQFGFVYVTGQYYQTSNFSDSLLTSNGLFDIYFAKYDIKEQAGLSEITNANELTIYPNPSTDFISFSDIQHDKTQVLINDINGKQVCFIEEVNSTEKYSIAQLNTGIYLVYLISSQGTIIEKLIKSN